MTLRPIDKALWANRVQRHCLEAAGGDVDAGFLATQLFLSTHPTPIELDPPLPSISEVVPPQPISAFFAHDIHNRKAQGILNRSLQAARGMSATARADLKTALKSTNGVGKFIEKYREQLARILTFTQLASILEGAQEVAAKVPTLADFPGAIPPPPSLEPKAAVQLVERLEKLGVEEQAAEVYKLTPVEQVYVRQAIAARAAPALVVAPIVPTTAEADDVHLVTIETAVKNLAERHVMDRQRYDALDSAARAKAFTVAGVEADTTLAKIRDSLSKNVKEGADYETWSNKVLEEVGEGTFLSDAHQETVFRTNVQTAFSDGQAAILAHPLVRGGFPYSAYDAIHDRRTRETHLAMEKHGIQGTNIYRNDDPVFQMFRPPWDYSDRCSWTPITIRQAAERGIAEAKEWLKTGEEPKTPTHVKMPDFRPPEGFDRSVLAAPLSIQLSLKPIDMFAQAFRPQKEATSDDPVQRQPPTVWTREDYPRDAANRFLNKQEIVAAAKDAEELAELRESLPEDQRPKLDRAVVVLQAGGTIHRPGEPPGLGINLQGYVPDSNWALYGIKLLERREWEDRDEERADSRRLLGLATKALRRREPDLDDVAAMLKAANAPELEIRTLARARHRAKVTKLSEPTERLALLDLYENAIESAYKKLEVDADVDREVPIPEPPMDRYGTTPALSIELDLRGKGGVSRPQSSSNATWITVGGHPDAEKGTQHSGGFRVAIDGRGTILTGRMRGTKVSNLKSNFARIDANRGHNGPQQHTTGTAGRSVGRGGGGVPGGPPQTGGPVAGAPPRPGTASVGQGEQGANQPTGAQSTQSAAPATGADTGVGKETRVGTRLRLKQIHHRLKKYSNHFKANGNKEVAGWMDELKAHIDALGPEGALEALRDVPQGEGKLRPVQYKGTGYFGGDTGVTTEEAAFLESYLNRSGITLMTDVTPKPNMPVISSAPLPTETEVRPKSVVPTEYRFLEDKLAEAKSLPGLESSEDIHTVVGKEVTHFTPEVMAKFDAKYGKGKWVVKPYGNEAYASFGVMFPSRIKEIQRSSKETLYDTNQVLQHHGYSLARENGMVVGVKANRTGAPTIRFGSTEFAVIPNKHVRRHGRVAAACAPSEKFTQLPVSPEVNLRQNFGITLRRGPAGKVTSVITEDGKEFPVDAPEVKKIDEDIGHHIERSINAVNSGQVEDSQFMVQPAFPALGVTEADRAEGATWEASTEGRVHVTTKGGKASVIPYATMANRGDSLPATFYNEDIYNMEKAVEDAINALPPEDRNGQVYAPDVMKTGDKKVNGGWKVIELNASTEGAQSLWLEENPFVIDAYVSHMTNREPSHVKFIRNLLKDKMGVTRDPRARRLAMKNPQQPLPIPFPEVPVGGKAAPLVGTAAPGPQLSFNDDHPRRSAGQEGGGQFVKKGAVGGTRTIQYGSLKASFTTYMRKKINGKSIKLQNYVQEDEHSCAFCAAMTVARYYHPHLTAKDVLKQVRPLVSAGVDRAGIVRGLRKLGVRTEYRTDLGIPELRKYVARGVPVIVSVWPDEWDTDHWTIVQGFDDEKVYLTNHRSLSIAMFRKQWIANWEDGSTKGAGLVCLPSKRKPGVALATDSSGHEHRGKGKGGGQFVSKGRSKNEEEVEFDEFPDELEDLIRPAEARPAPQPIEETQEPEPQESKRAIKDRARDLLKKAAKAASTTVGTVKTMLAGIFKGALGKVQVEEEGTTPETTIRPASFKHGVNEAVRRVKGMGFTGRMFKDNLRASPELRQYAVRDYNSFNNQMHLIDGYLKSAAQMSDRDEVKKAVVEKLKELDGLMQDVIAFRAKKAPEQNASVRTKKGGRNAARENMKRALEVLSKNPDVHSAVREVMRYGKISEATAKRYVRAALLYTKENMEIE